MVVATISLDIAWADIEENIFQLKKSIEVLPDKVDLVVLPELWSSGYVSDSDLLSGISAMNQNEVLRQLKDITHQHNFAIAGSFIASNAGKYYNRAFFIEPSGEESYYDKAHLFSLSSESKVYERGVDLYNIVRFRGWNIAMIVCYDLRFPAWCRNADVSYDMMLVPANWPQSRKYAWEHLLIARGIENQAIYVGCNRSGKDDFGIYDDMSMMVDGLGKRSDKAIAPIVSIAEFNKDVLEESRKKLPFQSDSDPFLFNSDRRSKI